MNGSRSKDSTHSDGVITLSFVRAARAWGIDTITHSRHPNKSMMVPEDEAAWPVQNTCDRQRRWFPVKLTFSYGVHSRHSPKAANSQVCKWAQVDASQSVSSWILTSTQPRRVTPGRSRYQTQLSQKNLNHKQMPHNT